MTSPLNLHGRISSVGLIRLAPRRAALKHRVLAGLAISGALYGSPLAMAESGTWIVNKNENWSATANWAGGTIADGQGAIADFSTVNISGNRTVTIDTTSRTVGVLKFGDTDGTHRYIFSASGGAGLIFDNGVSPAQIEVALTSGASLGIDTINAPIRLKSSLDINSASPHGLSISSSSSIVADAAGTMTITNKGTGSGGVTIAAAISDGAPGQVIAVNQNSATSLLTLSGVNTYSGGTMITSGTLALTGATSAGTGAITFNGGVLNLSNSISNSVVVADGTTSTFNILGPTNRTLGSNTGSFSGGGTLNVNLNGLTLNAKNAMTDFTGVISFDASSSGIILFTGAENTGSASAMFDLGDNSVTLRGSDLAVSKTINLGALKGGSNAIVEGGSGNVAIVDTFVIGEKGESTTFNGTIRNNGGINPHRVAIIKDGGGVLTLGGVNTYSGTTMITNGTLFVSGSLAGTASTTVENGILAGTGLIANGVIIGDDSGAAASASLAPGGNGAIGILKLGELDMNHSDAAFRFDLQTFGVLQSDQIQITGALMLGEGVAQFIGTDLLTASLMQGETIALATATDGITGHFAGLAEQSLYTLGANVYRISYGVDVANALTLTVIPEPGMWELLAGGAALLVVIGQLRKSRQGSSYRHTQFRDRRKASLAC